jgi:hypothetical protein
MFKNDIGVLVKTEVYEKSNGIILDTKVKT